jgi:aldehyde dehydrogenase (NAD+)
MLIQDRLFIGGEWRTPLGRDTIDVVSPATEEVVGRAPLASAEDAASAVRSAREAFDSGPWPRLSVAERSERIDAFADAIAERSEQFADVLCLEQGLPRHTLPAGQIAKAVSNFRAYVQIAADFDWVDSRPGTAGRRLRVRRVPVGVVTAIVPWNAPLMIAAMKLAPALIAGNTVVLKAPVETPLHTYLLADAALAAGIPAGVLNIVAAEAQVSELLVRDPGVDEVSFTGSTVVGRQVGAICGGELRRCTLELGGKSAAIVLDDFDLTPANVKLLLTGAMVNSGQVCAAQSRVLAPRSMYHDVVEALAEASAALHVGDPSQPDTEIGPLISSRHRARVENYIAAGVKDGATLVSGGGRPDMDRGWYVEPTVFAQVDGGMTIAREEIFGPVAVVLPYDGGDDDAVAMANDSDYGLAGAVYTSELTRGEQIAAQVRAGAVAVNSPGTLDVYGPFGGFKNSGIGREGGPEALTSYTELQTVLLPK